MAKKQPKFQIVRSIDNQFYFRFVGKNGETICTSEMYTTKVSVKKGIRAVGGWGNDVSFTELATLVDIEDLT